MICDCGGITKQKKYTPNINDYRVDCKDALIKQERTDKKDDLLYRLGRGDEVELLNIPYCECVSCGRISKQ